MSKPGRGARGRALCRGVTRLTESRDGGRVALPRRAPDMMSTLYRRCAARGERLGASLVRAQSPTAGRRLVERPSNERMPEAKAARHLGLTNEVELQQFVQSLERRRLGSRRGGRGELGLERVAGYRRPLHHEASSPTGDRAPRPARQQPRAAHRDPPARAQKRLSWARERAIGRAARDRTGCRRSPRRERLQRRRRPFHRGARAPRRVSERRPRREEGSPRGALARARRRRAPAPGEVGQRAHEHGRGRRPAQQRAEQFYGCGIGPVEVVEHEHERSGRGESFEQLAHRAMASVALVLEHSCAVCREPRERRKDVSELGTNVVSKCLEATRLKPLDVLVKRIDEHPEGQVSLELRCRP